MHVDRRLRIFFLLLIVCSLFFGVMTLRPPKNKPATSAPSEFSAERALEKLRPLTEKPRPVGSAAHEKAREFIVAQLRALGLDPEIQESVVANTFAGWIKSAHVSNVIARIPGSQSSGALLAAAHYDSVPNSFGASDDGAGVVTLLETARALITSGKLKNDIILLFTDAEENGTLGASAFAFEHPWAKDVKTAFNFEARGNRGPVAMFETSQNNGRLIREFATAAQYPAANSFVSAMAKILPNDTDFTVFKHAGMSGLNFAYADGINNYHSFGDSLKNLDPDSLQHDGEYALSLLRHFGNLELNFPPEPNRVYFDVLGFFLVQYASVWNFVFGALIFGILIRILYQCRKSVPLSQVTKGTGWFFLMIVCGVVISSGLMYGLVALKPPSLLLTHSALNFLGIALVTTSCFLWFLGQRVGAQKEDSFILGAFVFWALVGAVTVLFAPGMAYMFQWPLLLALISFTFKQTLMKKHSRLSVPGLATLTLLLSAFAANTTYTMQILDGGMAPAVPMLFWTLFFGLLSVVLALLSSEWLKRGAIVTVIPGVVLLSGLLAMTQYSEQTPRRNSMYYILDAVDQRAYWGSFNSTADSWTGQFIKDFGHRDSLPNIFLQTYEPALDEAPKAQWTPPEVKLLSQQTEANKKTFNFEVHSPRGAACFTIWNDSDAKIENTRIDHKAPHALIRFSPETDQKLWHYIAGDTSTADWKMEFCGLQKAGVRISFQVSEGSNLKLRIVDESFGLPSDINFPYKPRPPDMIPSRGSDVSLMGAMYEFPLK